MKDRKEFHSLIKAVEGRPYEQYAQLVGDFDFARYVLKLNQIMPAGQPTMLVLRVPQTVAAFPPHLFNSPVRRTALEDLLSRHIDEEVRQLAEYSSSGISRRLLDIAGPEQQILPRTSLVVSEEYVEARVYVDLPVDNGRIPPGINEDLFFEQLPRVVNSSLLFCNLDEARVETATDLMEDADQLRQMLPTRGLVAFAASGSMLERDGGSDDPALVAPTLEVDSDHVMEMEVPNAHGLKGLGFPTGLTVVVGDAFSGRSQLLKALAMGIYNHTPGDGRELVVTVPDAVYVPADPGRSVQRVDMSAFLDAPHGGERVTTDHADPVTSQIAGVMEALEAGAKVLLFDEVDSAVSFLGLDGQVQALTGAESPITPLAARIRELVDELGVSLVVGADVTAASFIPAADTVLKMENYQVTDMTASAKEAGLPVVEPRQPGQLVKVVDKARWLVPTSIDASVGSLDEELEAPDRSSLLFGRHFIDLEHVVQLADVNQTRTIAYILAYARTRYLDEGRPVRELLDLIDRDLSSEGLECLTRELNGELARPRRYEIAAALNRLSSLRISHTSV